MRVVLAVLLAGCGQPMELEPIVASPVPEIEALPVDSGEQLGARDTGTLSAGAFDCAVGSVALGLKDRLGLQVFTWSYDAAVCLWPGRRPAADPRCPIEHSLPRRLFERSAAEVLGGGDVLQVCLERIVSCPDGRLDEGGMLSPTGGSCRGPWREHVAVYLQVGEPAEVLFP